MKYSVWPVPVPPAIGYWGQESWRKYDEQFRPDDYSGGMYDQKAWEEYIGWHNEAYIINGYREFLNADDFKVWMGNRWKRAVKENKLKTLTLLVRTWRDTANANKYHNFKILIDGVYAHAGGVSGGSHWEDRCLFVLQRHDVIPEGEQNLREYAERQKIELYIDVAPVKNKGNLR